MAKRASPRERILREFMRQAGVTRKQAALILESLVQLVYREARGGFVIPGLCRVEVVGRKARRARNPRTGEWVEIPAREVLRIRPLQKACEAVTGPAPKPKPLTPEMAEALPPPPEASTVGSLAAPATLVSFPCRACGAEIEATADLIGTTVPCPACGERLEVPDARPARGPAAAGPSGAPPPEATGEMFEKGSTIRIRLPEGYELPKPPKRTIVIRRRETPGRG